MNEKLKDIEIYNKELKDRYLETMESEASIVLKYIFYKSSDLENQYNTDLANFSSQQFEEFLIDLNRKSLPSLSTALSLIKNYIDFAIQEGYVKNFLNIADTFSRENLKKYVNRVVSDNKHLSYEVFNDLVDKLINAQDQAIFMLLWEGVKGETYEELINLRNKDVDIDNNILHLTKNDGTVRDIEVSNKTIGILTDAMTETRYEKNNGDIEENSKMKSTFILLGMSEFIIRPAGKNKVGKILPQNIISRLKKMSKWYGNPYLTPVSIWESGMIDYGKRLKKEKSADLENNDYMIIHERFGLNPNSWYQTKLKIEKLI